MSSILPVESINALKDLFQTKEEDSDSEDEKPKSAYAKMNPSNIGPTQNNNANKPSPAPINKDEIWNSDEVAEGSHFQDIYDPRPEPDYDIHYKQAVTSEDIYLQLGNKTPCTSSCEDMVIIIKLPGNKLAEINLDVKPKFLDLRTPKYRLGLHLPNPVDSDKGKAEWNNDKNELTVTLRNIRDYDVFNF